MRRALVIISLAAGSVILFGAGRPKPAESATSAEVARLQHHFDSVGVELRSRDVSSLTRTQRVKRARLAGWLQQYRNAATFPKNDRFAVATPFFRDAEGSLCAMAYLIDRSGRHDLVESVASTRNNAYIRELAGDPALIAWLDSAGLSVAEAARIQPAYNGGFPISGETNRVTGDFALAAIALGSVSLATSAVNVVKPSYLGGVLGVLAGTTAVITGANHLDGNRATERVGIATIALGGVSIASGIYGILEAREKDDDTGRDRDKRGDRHPRRRATVVTPDVIFAQSAPRLGVLVHTNF